MTVLRVGMIGTGWMGDAIVDDFRSSRLDLHAVAGRDRDRTERFAEVNEIPRAVSVDELLRLGLDLIYVATPHNSHLALAERALSTGHPVLVEKAFTMDGREAEELISLARRRGLFLMEAMWMRFTPGLRRAAGLIADGAIGDPRTLMASFGMALPFGDHRLRDPDRGGGSLLDQGVYPIALADEIFGEPDTVAATGSTVDADGRDLGVETEVAMLLGYRSGQQAAVATSFRTDLPLSATIGGYDGRISLEPAFWNADALVLHRRGRDPERIEFRHTGRGYVPMLDAVHEALVGGWAEHPLSDHAATLRVMRTADRVRDSLRSGPDRARSGSGDADLH